MKKSNEFFPIKTATACPLKWNWSSLFFNSGESLSCHRASVSKLNVENFFDFHNTPEKIQARQKMLQGIWPSDDKDKYDEKFCGYCRKIEDAGGFSDRQYHMEKPKYIPKELYSDPTSLIIQPTILELYFSNTCNLACYYCKGELSSKIAFEDSKWGYFKNNDVEIKPGTYNTYKDLIDLFWIWFEKNGSSLQRLNVLGGEPFLQKEFKKLVEAFDKNPNPNCELSLSTNLALPQDNIVEQIEKIKKLVRDKKIKRLDLVCSIDCWGPQQEYARLGLNLDLWEKNFNYIMNEKWIYLCTNSVISTLTIKTMADLFEKINSWKKTRKIHQQVNYTQGQQYLKPEIFGGGFFTKDIEKILNCMTENNEEEKSVKKYLHGIFQVIESRKQDKKNIENFMIYLKEKDRRRNTDYKNIFPWLIEFDTI